MKESQLICKDLSLYFEKHKGDNGEFTNMKTVFRGIFLGNLKKKHMGSHLKVVYLN